MSQRKQQHARQKRKNAAAPKLRWYSKDDLVLLSKEDPVELIKDLSTEIKRFQGTLDNNELCKNNFQCILLLLLKVCSGLGADDDDLRSRSLNILGEAFSHRCTAFQDNLKQNICRSILYGGKNAEEKLGSVCSFFEVLLQKTPDTFWSVLPVDELLVAVQDLAENDLLDSNDDLLPKAEHLVEQRNLMKDQKRVMLVDSNCTATVSKRTWDNREYREVQILPRWEEIRNPKPPYQLRPNIVEGKYEDWMHYYDVQFRLLREDFISPLRKGIGDYLHGKVGRDLRNVKVYHRVKIKRLLFTRAGLCHEVKFDPTPFRTYRWEYSKRLIFGSLLCLSPDHFHSKVFFATVSNRDPKQLTKGFLEVMFQGSSGLLAHIKLETEFTMVESLAYFEASRHILRSLQTAEIDTMPFTNYLIANDCRAVLHPKYLNKGDTPSTYNIQFIIKHYDKAKKVRVLQNFTNVAITEDSQWPNLKMTELDESQLKAMKMALTQEIAVIQGPPGTGKTYMGLKIVQALLANRRVWNTPNLSLFGNMLNVNLQSPILVMCFTNHALDQFLEGILEMHEGEDLTLIRIGGRSKSEKIQECSLYNVKRKLRCVPSGEYVRMKQLGKKAEEEGARCNQEILTYRDPHHFVPFSEIQCVMEEHLYWSLIEPAETDEEERLALELWLGLCTKQVQEEYIPIPASKNSNFTASGSQQKPSDSSGEGASSGDDSSFEDGSSSEGTGPTMEGVEETINIVGDASIEEDKRMIDGMTEMFEEMKFDSRDLPPTEQEGAKLLYDVRRTFKIVKNRDDYWLKKDIMWKSAMPEKNVLMIDNVYTLQLEDRYKLYKYWHNKYKAYLMNRLETGCEEFNDKCEVANRARQRADRYPLEKADVIGMTTTGAAKYQHILHLVKPKIVIVEEAAEVLESHIVSALNAGTQHLILIGDHKQLRPNPNEYDLAVKYHLDISLFERLVRNDFPHVTLQIQHRMRPEIADLVRGHIYDVLYDHKSVESYPKVKGVTSNLFLIQHCEPEKANDLSHSNEYEAAYLASLCKFLLQQGYSPSQITVLVTYTGQLLLMKKFMPKATFEDVRVTTVDNFQGEENDIILLSLVRSNERGVIGFLKAENRVCVSLSRAKHGFYCIGNFELLRKVSETWQNIVSDMESKEKVGESLIIHCNNHPQFQKRARFPGDFAKHFPTGGCHLPCEYRLKCGHVCALTCHSFDPEHEKYMCKKPVSNVCPEGHTINKLCFEESICTKIVERVMPKCGHLQEMFCHEDPGEVCCQQVCIKTMPRCDHSQEVLCSDVLYQVACQNKCERKCPKGHTCPLLCYQGCKPCMEQSEIQLPLCGHKQLKYCYQEIADIKCMVKCEKECKSGHLCRLKCYQECRPCGVVVKKVFPCSHTGKVKCSEQSIAKCNEPCPKHLSCDHKCPLLCGEPCNDASCPESVKITLPRCKHKETIPCHKNNDHLYRWRVKCTNPCQKKLTCSHDCTGICGDPCIVRCEVGGIRRTCPQGHRLIRKCFETLDYRPCEEACKRKLKCSHCCQNRCNESCTTAAECKFMIIKDYPCGHQHRLPCSTSIQEHPCDIICRTSLTCGHTCRGKCSKCLSTRIHKPCEYFVTQPHFCGEQTPMKCVGFQDRHDKARVAEPRLKVLPCLHTKMPYECGKDIYKCSEPCGWSCPHQECTKLCHELCDRPPCEKKCPLPLECGHQCVGLCGEACINDCPECDSESFSTLLVMSERFSAEQIYTQLPCGHVLAVPDMDKYVSQKQGCDVGPLQCPECSSLLSCSYRYGKAVKEALSHVEAVKVKVQASIVESNMSAEDKDHLHRIVKHSFSNFSETKLVSSDIFSKPILYLNKFKRRLVNPQEVVSREEGFMIFMLSKIFAFASCINDSVCLDSYQLMMIFLTEKKNQQLSHQLIQDLMSELYRLCFQAKLNSCQQHFFGSSMKALIDKESGFLMHYDNPKSRMSKKDFISHSRLLDIISKRLSTFESTNEFVKDLERFCPSNFSGCWQKCDFGHYYCIPVCKRGGVTMKCPDCTGSYVESVCPVKTPWTVAVDITEQLSEVVKTMKSKKKSDHGKEAGEDVGPTGKKKKKRKRRH